MTPEQVRAIEEAAAAGLVVALQEAYAKIVDAIRAGTPPRDAVQAAMDSFTGEMAGTMAAALSAVLQTSVGTGEVMALQVGQVALSRRLYAETTVASQAVEGAVTRHVAGFQDSRRLARDLFEGYSFRPPDAEPIKFNRANPILPKYMREALMTDDKVAGELARAFARLQVNGLKTEGLRAAYADVLRAIDKVQAGAGDELLQKRITVAFYERMRYFAERISRTELHRAYAQREAELLMADQAVEFVQVRRVPGRVTPCICALMTGRDLYGLGPGVYPKARAPKPPFHPFCLPGDARVTAAGRVLAATKRWFDGDLAVITTASGKRLAATVNHPVLTRRGWVGAGLLDVGDDVFTRVEPVAVGGDAFLDQDHQDVPPSIAEIADAILGSSEVTTREVPVAAEHFHGDGEGSDVAVVGADGKLWDRVQPEAAQVSEDHPLKLAGTGLAGLLGERVLDLGGEAPGLAGECGVCGGHVGAALFGTELGIPDDLGSAAVAPLNASVDQPPVDDVAADTKLARQLQNGASGPVFADQVVHIEFQAFSGYVFNLQTEEGHFTANGIVTHNCQCVMSPRLDLTGRTAKPLDEGGDAYFLRRVGQGFAARVMGSQAKADEVLAGKPALDVVNRGRDPLYHVRPVRAG
jgi:hypothetical protein